MVEPINAAESTKTVELPKSHTALLTSYLVNDREQPSKERARQRREVFTALRIAHGAELVDDVLAEADQGGDELRALVSVQMDRGTMAALLDFATEALSKKDKEGKAVLNGLQQDRMLELIDVVEAARGPVPGKKKKS